jgi:hypothetical protein
MRRRLAAGAAIPGIIRRRLQPRRRADAAVAAIDRGIEQFRKHRPDRQNVGAACFGSGGFAAPFAAVGSLRHARNM